MAGADEAPPEKVVAAQELRCPACNGPWTPRGFATTRTLACEYCGAVIDTSGERWQVAQRVQGAYEVKPVFKLGTRGKLDDTTWEVIGWAERSVRAMGTRYPWQEHLLYNPYEGFRYLIYQDGHFTLVEPLPGVPSSGANEAVYEGTAYRHFSSGTAVVDEVLGEFPWEMRRGDQVTAVDYVSPPFMLSSEKSAGEVTWSLGRYLERDEVVRAFGKPTRPLGWASGVHPCQPNPHQPTWSWMWKVGGVAAAVWVLVALLFLARAESAPVQFFPGPEAEEAATAVVPAGATPTTVCVLPADTDLYTVPVRLPAGKVVSTLEVQGSAQVNNSWVFLNLALIDPLTERASYVPLELSYYHGVDGGESWSEGGQSASQVVGGVVRGDYLLQVQRSPDSTYKGPVELRMTQDVPLFRYPCCAFFFLLLVPLFVLARLKGFEQRRWAESDHAS